MVGGKLTVYIALGKSHIIVLNWKVRKMLHEFSFLNCVGFKGKQMKEYWEILAVFCNSNVWIFISFILFILFFSFFYTKQKLWLWSSLYNISIKTCILLEKQGTWILHCWKGDSQCLAGVWLKLKINHTSQWMSLFSQYIDSLKLSYQNSYWILSLLLIMFHKP